MKGDFFPVPRCGADMFDHAICPSCVLLRVHNLLFTAQLGPVIYYYLYDTRRDNACLQGTRNPSGETRQRGHTCSLPSIFFLVSIVTRLILPHHLRRPPLLLLLSVSYASSSCV